MVRCSVLQTCVPAYRLPVFDSLAEEMGEEFRVVAGDRFFEPSIRTVAQDRPWFRACTNHFSPGNRLLWQGGSAVRGVLSGPFIVEANPRCLRTWILLIQARLRGVPTAVWGHALGRGMAKRKMGTSRRAMFALADTIICYGFAEGDLLSALFPHKRILVAGNSTVSVEDCRPLETLAAQRCSVLFLGRMVKAKKPMLLLRALHVLQGQGLHIGAVFVGEGPERPECETFARSTDLQNILFAREEFSRSKIRQLAADCFAVASPGYVGLSVLDALSMGLPVVFSHDEPNAPEVEVLEEATSALAFTGDNPQSLADAIHKLYTERVVWLGRGGQLCDTVKERYSIARMVTQFTEFFRRADA